MRKVVVKQPGGLENLLVTEHEVPEPGVGEVRVRWRASSLNYHDYLVAIGGIPVAQDRVPMSDGAGDIDAVGEGVSNWKVGDKVMSMFFPDWFAGRACPEGPTVVSGESVDGYAAEYSCVSAQSLTSIPDEYSYAQAATLPCAALTAWRALVPVGQLKAGDSVLVQGSGGVSLFALQFAKSMGAYVYATTSSDEKSQRLRALGADEVINYKTDEKWGRTLAKMSGGGIDHILDVGGPSTLTQSIDAVAMSGQVTLIGILGGRTAEVVLPKLFFKHASLNGIAVGSREMQNDMIKSINTTGLKPVIDKSFQLDQLKQAFEYQVSGAHMGKIVLEY